jgi:AcrR family transcriptional regulator
MDKQQGEILCLATQLFSKYGLKSVSIDDICSQLGISKKTFYNYYRQKSDLIADVLNEIHKSNHTIQNFMEKLYANPDLNAIDKIMGITDYFLSNKEKSHHSFYYDLSKYYSDIYEKFNMKKEKEVIEFTRQEIQNGIKEGIYRKDINVDLTARFLSFQFKSVMSSIKKRSELMATFSFVVDAYIRIVVNDEGMKYYQEKYLNKNNLK